MKKFFSVRMVCLGFLCLAGAVMSQKPPPRLVISQAIQNNSRLMTLEWASSPGRRYAVESSNHIGGWTTIASNLQDPSRVGILKYPIPVAYLYDSERFFRVRVEPLK
jgi:hypothetical protein